MQTGLRGFLRAVTASPARLRVPVAVNRVQYQFSQFRWASTKRYTEEHEVVNFDDSTGVGIVGITDHAQQALGDIVYVELPAVGTVVTKGDQIGAVESVKSASDIYAPISGTIEEINEALNDQPGLINKSAEQDGWLCKIKASEPVEIGELLSAEAYTAQIEEGGH